MSLNGRVNDGWLVVASFANTDARDDRTGTAIALVPKNRLTLFNRFNVGHGPLKGLNLGFGAIFTGSRPLTATSARGAATAPNWGPLPAAWRFDATLGYKYRPAQSRFSYDFGLNITNLFDRTDLYYLAAWDRATIDPGRTIRFTTGVRF